MQHINVLQKYINNSIIPAFEPILYDPGIPGFVKAHRHSSGPAVVMTTWEEEDRDWVAVFWVKRLHHAAKPVQDNIFWLWTEQTLKAAERTYDLLMMSGPPVEARPDFQRERVYNWEDDNIFPGRDQELTWDDCHHFLDRVWREVGKGRPVPKLSNETKYRRAISFTGRIYLPKDHRLDWNKPTLLHEIAHQFEFADQHGPRFVSHYMKLCMKFLDMKLQYLQETADRYEVLYR